MWRNLLVRGPVPRAGLRGGKGSGDWGGGVGGRPAACGAELRAGRWGCGRGALSTSALCLQAGPGVRVWQNVYRGCRGAPVLVWVKVVAIPSSLPPPLPS